jgi:hypothetical protein
VLLLAACPHFYLISTPSYSIPCRPHSGSYRCVFTAVEQSATLAPFPFAGLNPRQKLINVKVKALYDADNDVVAPHGLFGQSYDGDEVAVDGAVDARNQEEATTTAQAEGAIEGVIADYKMADKFATEFKYSRFDATSAPHRDVTKLTGWKHAAKKPISVGATDVDDAEASPVQSTD